MLTVYPDERVSGVVMILATINHLIPQHIIHFTRKGTVGYDLIYTMIMDKSCKSRDLMTRLQHEAFLFRICQEFYLHKLQIIKALKL